MVLFHETFWVSDTIRLLAERSDFVQLVPAIKPRVLNLLAKQFNTLELRAFLTALPAGVDWRDYQMAVLRLMEAM
jgi:hypothetical protein